MQTMETICDEATAADWRVGNLRVVQAPTALDENVMGGGTTVSVTLSDE